MEMALRSACYDGILEEVRRLIQDGHNVNTRSGFYGTTSLMAAARVMAKWWRSSSEKVLL